MNEQKDEQNLTEALWRDFFSKGIRNTFIIGIILAVVWEVLTWVVPEGWPMTVVNIFFFIISLWVFGYTLLSFLKATLPTWFAWVISLLCWVLVFVGLRSLLAFVFT